MAFRILSFDGLQICNATFHDHVSDYDALFSNMDRSGFMGPDQWHTQPKAPFGSAATRHQGARHMKLPGNTSTICTVMVSRPSKH